VEDDNATAALVRTALEENAEVIDYHRVSDVDKALECLSTIGRKSARAAPTLILLDLHLHARSGFEILIAVRDTKALAHIRVVVFTSSTSPQDEEDARGLGAFAYLHKPWTFDGYLSILGKIVAMVPPFQCAITV
jgi:CheY-like chemotaxis protein